MHGLDVEFHQFLDELINVRAKPAVLVLEVLVLVARHKEVIASCIGILLVRIGKGSEPSHLLLKVWRGGGSGGGGEVEVD